MTAMIFALTFMPMRTANAAGAYSMTINNFDVEYVIGSDRTIAVEERVEISYEGTSNTGFYRDLPVNAGDRVFDVDVAELDGGSETAGAAAKELEEAKDRLLRVTAEYSNYKRRSEKERQDAYSFAKADTVKELLPVIDDLERALANETEDYEALKKGVEMTFAKLGGVLEKLGIEVFGKPGETFDPNLHNAVMHIEDDKYAAGEIVDVYQKGYKIGDKIIRAAMVRTAN